MSRAVGLHTATTALISLASLSISSSASPPGALPASSPQVHTGPITIPVHSTPVARRGVSSSVPVDEGFGVSSSPSGVMSMVTRSGKKRGTIFTCESKADTIASQVYRHPSCLIKHRWEHTPHWREASKFLLSKHQQVQLMEVCGCHSSDQSCRHGYWHLPVWPAPH